MYRQVDFDFRDLKEREADNGQRRGDSTSILILFGLSTESTHLMVFSLFHKKRIF